MILFFVNVSGFNLRFSDLGRGCGWGCVKLDVKRLYFYFVLVISWILVFFFIWKVVNKFCSIINRFWVIDKI